MDGIVFNSSTISKFNKLKTELIKRLTTLQEGYACQFLTHKEIGDKKPSQLLRYLASLDGFLKLQDFFMYFVTKSIISSYSSHYRYTEKCSFRQYNKARLHSKRNNSTGSFGNFFTVQQYCQSHRQF